MEVLVPALGDNNLKVVQGALGPRRRRRRARGGFRAIPRRAVGAAGRWKRKAPVRSARRARRRGGDARGAAGARARSAAAGVRAPQPARAQSALLCLGRTLAAQEGGGPAAAAAVKGCMPLVLTLLEDREPPVREAAVLALEQVAPARFGATRRNFGAILSAHLPRARPRGRTATLATSSSTTCAAATCGRRSPPLLERLGLGGGGSPESPTRDGGYGYSDRPDPPKRAATTPHLPVRPASARAGGGVSSHRGGAPPLDEGEEVEPTVVYSERELSKEMESVGELLRNADEWTVRQAALRKLKSLVLGGAIEFDGFLPLLRGLREPLAKELGELRSSLVKEACGLIELMATTLMEGFEPLVDTFLPVLLKNTCVTIAVISATSNETTRTVLAAVRPIRAFPRLLAGVTDRAATLRSRCVPHFHLLERIPVAPEASAPAREARRRHRLRPPLRPRRRPGRGALGRPRVLLGRTLPLRPALREAALVARAAHPTAGDGGGAARRRRQHRRAAPRRAAAPPARVVGWVVGGERRVEVAFARPPDGRAPRAAPPGVDSGGLPALSQVGAAGGDAGAVGAALGAPPSRGLPLETPAPSGGYAARAGDRPRRRPPPAPARAPPRRAASPGGPPPKPTRTTTTTAAAAARRRRGGRVDGGGGGGGASLA